jgi:hypothetical protein
MVTERDKLLAYIDSKAIAFPDMVFTIEKVMVTAKPRVLKCNYIYTEEEMQDDIASVLEEEDRDRA